MKKEKLLVLASSFPRNKEEIKGFIYILSERLTKDFEVYMIVPHSGNALLYEEMGELKVYRHKITPWGDFGLSYDSGILPNIKKKPVLALLIPFFIISQIFAIRRLVRQESISTIHAHWVIPQGFSAVLYKVFLNSKIKILVSALGSDINFFDNFLGNSLKKFILSRVNWVTVVSRNFKEKVERLGYRKEISVFPLGVDTNVFRPERRDESIRDKFGIKGEMILFVGWVIEFKGIRFLIQAMERVTKIYPDVCLVIVGIGNLLEEMKELTAKLNLTQNVFFAGRVSDEELPSYYATADLFVLPSFSEGFPVVVEEAMASGTLSVVSDIPVFVDLAKDIPFVKITRKANADDIAEQIISNIREKENGSTLKTQAREYAVKNFDWNVIANKFSNVLRDMK